MILTSTQEFTPHAPGIFAAVCVDVVDIGIEMVEYDGRARNVRRVRLLFETMAPDGKRELIGRSFTASLATNAKLAEFLGKWRGKPVAPGDTIDLGKLPGLCCTLVISHVPRADGQGHYARIDAVSRPNRQIAATGIYDPAAERQRIEERKAGRVRSVAPVGAVAGAGERSGVEGCPF